MTALGKDRPGRKHDDCEFYALVKEFSNGRRLIFCTKCGLLEWEDVHE